MIVKDKPYLLRIITRDDLAADRIRQYNCIKAAAEAGIAPAVLYTNIEDKISITDFVEVKPFPIEDARAKMPELILVSAESKLQYAWAHFLQMLSETRTKRFEESLAIVSKHKS